MYCSRCGENNENGARFCRKCGAPLMQSQNYTQMNENGQMNTQINVQTTQGMKWYKFIIYVQLFIMAFSEVVNVFQFFGKNKYGDSTEWLYLIGSSLKVLDMIDCIVGIGIAVAAIIIRMQLAHFKRGASQNYLVLLLVQTIRLTIYLIGVSIIFKYLDLTYYSVVSVLAVIEMVVMLIINYSYFGKRKQYFVR